MGLGLIRPAPYAALVAAGLISVVLFPVVALALARASTGAARNRRTNGAVQSIADVGLAP
jgi:hypothetical protein